MKSRQRRVQHSVNSIYEHIDIMLSTNLLSKYEEQTFVSEGWCHERAPRIQLNITGGRAYQYYGSVPIGDCARVPWGSR